MPELLSSNFNTKDMGEVSFILGIKIMRDENKFRFNQSHYIDSVLRKFRQFDYAPITALFDPNVKLMRNKGKTISQL